MFKEVINDVRHFQLATYMPLRSAKSLIPMRILHLSNILHRIKPLHPTPKHQQSLWMTAAEERFDVVAETTRDNRDRVQELGQSIIFYPDSSTKTQVGLVPGLVNA